jgi:hypothetical protein
MDIPFFVLSVEVFCERNEGNLALFGQKSLGFGARIRFEEVSVMQLLVGLRHCDNRFGSALILRNANHRFDFFGDQVIEFFCCGHYVDSVGLLVPTFLGSVPRWKVT